MGENRDKESETERRNGETEKRERDGVRNRDRKRHLPARVSGPSLFLPEHHLVQAHLQMPHGPELPTISMKSQSQVCDRFLLTSGLDADPRSFVFVF